MGISREPTYIYIYVHIPHIVSVYMYILYIKICIYIIWVCVYQPGLLRWFVGSRGDVMPGVGISKALQDRGHEAGAPG